MLVVSLLAGCVFYDGVLSYSDGIFLLALAVIWLLYSVKIARRAEKQGQDSLTREQVAELPREGTLPVALPLAWRCADHYADGNAHGRG